MDYTLNFFNIFSGSNDMSVGTWPIQSKLSWLKVNWRGGQKRKMCQWDSSWAIFIMELLYVCSGLQAFGFLFHTLHTKLISASSCHDLHTEGKKRLALSFNFIEREVSKLLSKNQHEIKNVLEKKSRPKCSMLLLSGILKICLLIKMY